MLTTYRRAVAPHRRDARRLEQLTAREHDVLRCVAAGLSNQETAAALFVSEGTVESTWAAS